MGRVVRNFKSTEASTVNHKIDTDNKTTNIIINKA